MYKSRGCIFGYPRDPALFYFYSYINVGLILLCVSSQYNPPQNAEYFFLEKFVILHAVLQADIELRPHESGPCRVVSRHQYYHKVKR